jgi:hypothetical protein
MNRKGRNCCNKCEDEDDEQGGGKAKSSCTHKTKNNLKFLIHKKKMNMTHKKGVVATN